MLRDGTASVPWENITKMMALRGFTQIGNAAALEQTNLSNISETGIFGLGSARAVVYLYNPRSTTFDKLKKDDFTKFTRAFEGVASGDVENSHRLILVLGKLKSSSVKGVERLADNYTRATGTPIELFNLSFFKFFVPDHVMVPRHVHFPAVADVPAFLRKFRLEGMDPPKILTTDPLSRIFAAAPGDYFVVYRPDRTVGETVMVRKVVTPPPAT